MVRPQEGDAAAALLSLARELATLAEPGEIYDRIATVVPRVVDADASAVLSVDRQAGLLRVEGMWGWPEHLAESVGGFGLPIDASPMVERVLNAPEPFYVTPEFDDPIVQTVLTEFEADAALVVPISVRAEVIGLVAAVKRGPAPATMSAQLATRLQGLADHASIALDNAYLYAALQAQLEAAEAAEAEAHEMRSVLQHLLESGPVITFRGSTKNFHVTYVSQNVEPLLGYTPDAFLEQRWLNMVHPDDVETVWKAVDRLFEREDVATSFRFRDAGGRYRWLRTHLRGDLTQPPHEREILGYVWDETEAREAQARYRVVSELTSDIAYGYVVFPDGSYSVEWATDGIERLTGYPPDEVLKLGGWPALLHPDDGPAFETRNDALLSGEEVSGEFRIRTKSGQVRWFEISDTPAIDDVTGIVRVYGAVRDVTERVEAEERYRRVSELTSDLAYAYHVSPDGEPVLEWNTEGMERLTGYTTEEAIARGGWRGMLVPEDLPAYDARLQRVLSGEPVTQEFRIRTKEGEVRWLEISAQPVEPTESGMVRVFGAARDVTERRRVQERLAAREAQLREAQVMAQVGGWQIDIGSQTVDASEELARMFGLQSSRFEWSEIIEMIHPDDRTRMFEVVQEAAEAGAIADSEYRFMRPDGELRWMHMRAAAELDDEGQVVKVTGATQDVTERHRAAEYFRIISDAVSDVAFAFSVVSGRLRLDWVADAWERLTGHPPASLGGELFVPIAHEDDLEGMREAEERVLRGERTVDEFRVRIADGTWRWLRIYAIPVRHEVTDEVVRVYGAVQDVTEQRNAERTLAESEQRLRQLIDASPLAMLVFEPSRIVSMINPAAEAMFGWSLAEISELGGRPPWVPPGHETEFDALAAEVAGGRRVTGFETKRLHRDGTLIDVSLSVAPLDRGRDHPPGAIAVVSDISERQRLEEELRQAQKMTAIGRLAGGVAHDFNNILTTILGHAEFLLSDPVTDAELREHARAIAGAGERAAALTEQMLLLSRHRAPVAEVLDLRAEVADMHELLARIVGEHIEFEIEAAEERCVIRAPRAHVQQILLNLVVNARDAMPHGGRLGVSTTTEPRGDGDHAWVVLRVTDTGQGIPSEARERIFEPFFTTKETGTGLGLSVVYGIVDTNGGEITLTSAPGEGTSVEVRLPGTGAEPAAQAPAEPPDRASAGAVETILLVEDEADVRAVTAAALSRRGYRVVQAGDALEALTLSNAELADIALLVTDLVMPHMGGSDLVERLQERKPDLRVLYVSGFRERAGDVPDAAAEGMFLQKPFTPAELLAAVQEALGGARVQSA